MTYTVTLTEAVGDRTVQRVLKLRSVRSQLEAMTRASVLHPDANLVRVEGPSE